jgi:hypothetical protein
MNYKLAVALLLARLEEAQENDTVVEFSTQEIEYLIDVFNSLIEL